MKEASQDNTDLLVLGYTSRAARGTGQDQLVTILRQSRKNNPALNVTGILLHYDDQYFQILEGPRENVEMLFNRIGEDPRHHDVRLLFSDYAEERRFGKWAMAWAKVDELPEEDRSACVNFFDNPNYGEENRSRVFRLIDALEASYA